LGLSDKLCGNCGEDHKYIECPYIEFKMTKEEHQRLLDKENNLNAQLVRINYLDRELNARKPIIEHYGEVMKKIHERILFVTEKLDNPTLSKEESADLQWWLQVLVDMFGVENFEKLKNHMNCGCGDDHKH